MSETNPVARYKEEHIKMQIVSCQYFSRDARIREGLQKKNKNVQTQILLLVTTDMLTLLISKTAAK